MELSCSNIKNNSYIFTKESFTYIFSKEIFSYISENEIPHFLSTSPKNKKFLIFREMELSGFSIKKILIFPEMEPCTFQPKLKKEIKHPRKFITLQETKAPKNFLYFLKKVVVLFRETENLKTLFLFQETELSEL